MRTKQKAMTTSNYQNFVIETEQNTITKEFRSVAYLNNEPIFGSLSIQSEAACIEKIQKKIDAFTINQFQA